MTKMSARVGPTIDRSLTPSLSLSNQLYSHVKHIVHRGCCEEDEGVHVLFLCEPNLH